MEFVETLDTFLSTPTIGFEFYGKEVTCETIHGTQKGELLGINSNGTITFRFGNTSAKPENDFQMYVINDIVLIDHSTEYSEDDDNKSVKQPGISIKDKVFDICKYKVVQQLIYTLFTNAKAQMMEIMEPLKIDNRKSYLDIRTDPAKKIAIAQKILNMKPLKMTNELKTGLNPFVTPQFTEDNMLSLLNSYHKLWINYIQKNNNEKTDDNQDVTMNENDKAKAQYTYLDWDNWTINGSAPVDKKAGNPKAEDVYLKYLWPYYFQGPYYKSLNSQANRDWKCKKCNKSPAGKVVEWYKDGTISTKCNICGNNCDKSCGLKHGEDLSRCQISRSNGTCKKCEHKVADHKHVGWKCREVAKDNAVMDAGRLKYFKTKRTVFTFEICATCVDAAQKKQKKKDKEKSTKLREKRKKRNKNKGKAANVEAIINAPQNRPPVMDFKNIVIPMKSDFKAKPKAKSKPIVASAAKPKAKSKKRIREPRIQLTQEMRDNTSVRAALCFIPPKELWPAIQNIRKIHDPAYVRWMPHLNIFFPFVDEKYFNTIANYIQQEIINRNNIKAFNITLNKFDVFERVKNKLGSKSSKVETMFLNPSGCDNEMQKIFGCLKGDWPKCANKHGGGFSPHLTVGKFKTKEMLDYQKKFQKGWKNISWKCDNLYLISRRGGDPFVIRHTISLC